MTPAQAALEIERFHREVVSDVSKLYEQIYPKAVDEINTVFETEGRGTWKPNAPSTRRRKPPGKKILRHRDNYYRAATQQGHAGHVKQIGKREMVIGIDPGFFEGRFGFNYPAKHEDERPVYRLVAEHQPFRNMIESMAQDYYKTKARKRGF